MLCASHLHLTLPCLAFNIVWLWLLLYLVMGSFPLQGLGLWRIETKKIDLRKTVLCWNSETLHWRRLHLLAQATRTRQTLVLPIEKWERISSLLQRGDSHHLQLSQWLIPMPGHLQWESPHCMQLLPSPFCRQSDMISSLPWNAIPKSSWQTLWLTDLDGSANHLLSYTTLLRGRTLSDPRISPRITSLVLYFSSGHRPLSRSYSSFRP